MLNERAVKLPCSHGWHVKCRKCAKWADELEAQFWRDVFFGKYNIRGYTPAEWAAKEKRDQERERTIISERAVVP